MLRVIGVDTGIDGGIAVDGDSIDGTRKFQMPPDVHGINVLMGKIAVPGKTLVVVNVKRPYEASFRDTRLDNYHADHFRHLAQTMQLEYLQYQTVSPTDTGCRDDGVTRAFCLAAQVWDKLEALRIKLKYDRIYNKYQKKGE